MANPPNKSPSESPWKNVLDMSLLEYKGTDRLQEVLRRANVWSKSTDQRGWDTRLIPYFHLVSFTLPEGKQPLPSVTFRYTARAEHTNPKQTLHGGFIATLFDTCTSFALLLINSPGFWFNLGITRSLTTQYFRPVPIGTDVLIECKVLQIGKKLCSIRGTMRRESDDALMAVCDHGKVNTDPEGWIKNGFAAAKL
ncbi:HotDog domain-containing protein [Apodospora peruviana]|uniref:HotDog domain-containing protein n=1 Tax=Apodospora peruviana TaxID=516989 RepID=A0AAE0I647_9PEZI|nr:HotDog domain-containing protein [Apodospora peruviana]